MAATGRAPQHFGSSVAALLPKGERPEDAAAGGGLTRPPDATRPLAPRNTDAKLMATIANEPLRKELTNWASPARQGFVRGRTATVHIVNLDAEARRATLQAVDTPWPDWRMPTRPPRATTLGAGPGGTTSSTPRAAPPPSPRRGTRDTDAPDLRSQLHRPGLDSDRPPSTRRAAHRASPLTAMTPGATERRCRRTPLTLRNRECTLTTLSLLTPGAAAVQRSLNVWSQRRTGKRLLVPDAQTLLARKRRASLQWPTTPPSERNAGSQFSLNHGHGRGFMCRTRRQFRRGRGGLSFDGLRTRRRPRTPPTSHAASPLGLSNGPGRSSSGEEEASLASAAYAHAVATERRRDAMQPHHLVSTTDSDAVLGAERAGHSGEEEASVAPAARDHANTADRVRPTGPLEPRGATLNTAHGDADWPTPLGRRRRCRSRRPGRCRCSAPHRPPLLRHTADDPPRRRHERTPPALRAPPPTRCTLIGHRPRQNSPALPPARAPDAPATPVGAPSRSSRTSPSTPRRARSRPQRHRTTTHPPLTAPTTVLHASSPPTPQAHRAMSRAGALA